MIVIIDNLYSPNIPGKIANGVQKFTRAQFEILQESGRRVHYICAAGSVKGYEDQTILKTALSPLEAPTAEKREVTQRLQKELAEVLRGLSPEVVLDSSCKMFRRVWPLYPTGLIFEHYHRPAFPLGEGTRKPFERHRVSWVGVSNWQKSRFRDLFDDVSSVHYLEDLSPPKEAAQPPYGVFIGRWDAGKRPDTALLNYIRSEANIPIKAFIVRGGAKIDPKIEERIFNDDLMTFREDAPREEIFDAVSQASFGLGMGNESTGIVSLEYGAFGVPYIVPGRGEVAEAEHLPARALHLADRSLEDSIPTQIFKHIQACLGWSWEERESLAQECRDSYNRQNFLKGQEMVISRAKERYPATHDLFGELFGG